MNVCESRHFYFHFELILKQNFTEMIFDLELIL